MFLFPRIAELRGVDQTVLQELVPLLEEMETGFTGSRIKDRVIEAGIWKDLEKDPIRIAHRVRRSIEHFIKIGYVIPEGQSKNWFLPLLDVIRADKKKAKAALATGLKKSEPNVAWMIGSSSILAAMDGDGIKEGESKASAKASARLGRFSKSGDKPKGEDQAD